MTSLTQNRITAFLAIALPLTVGLWLLMASAAAVSSTYVAVALLAIAIALISLNTWNNGQATGSMAQVIYEVDTTPALARAPSAVDERTSRWNAWLSRGDALAYTGRVRAMLAFSLALTGALLFYAWLA